MVTPDASAGSQAAALSLLAGSTQTDTEPVTLDCLVEIFDILRPRCTIACNAENDLAVRHAVKELNGEGYRVDVVTSQFVRPGEVFVMDPDAILSYPL